MALIQCFECRGKVSDLAAACPHCGAPVATGAAAAAENGRQAPPPWKSAGLWKHVTTVLGVSATAPWIARVLALLVAAIVAIVALLTR